MITAVSTCTFKMEYQKNVSGIFKNKKNEKTPLLQFNMDILHQVKPVALQESVYQ